MIAKIKNLNDPVSLLEDKCILLSLVNEIAFYACVLEGELYNLNGMVEP